MSPFCLASPMVGLSPQPSPPWRAFDEGPGLTSEADALELWHEHQTPIILAVFFALVTLRVCLRATEQRETLVAIPKLYDETKSPAADTEKPREKPQEESDRKTPGPTTDAQKDAKTG